MIKVMMMPTLQNKYAHTGTNIKIGTAVSPRGDNQAKPPFKMSAYHMTRETSPRQMIKFASVRSRIAKSMPNEH